MKTWDPERKAIAEFCCGGSFHCQFCYEAKVGHYFIMTQNYGDPGWWVSRVSPHLGDYSTTSFRSQFYNICLECIESMWVVERKGRHLKITNWPPSASDARAPKKRRSQTAKPSKGIDPPQNEELMWLMRSPPRPPKA